MCIRDRHSWVKKLTLKVLRPSPIRQSSTDSVTYIKTPIILRSHRNLLKKILTIKGILKTMFSNSRLFFKYNIQFDLSFDFYATLSSITLFLNLASSSPSFITRPSLGSSFVKCFQSDETYALPVILM